MRMAAAGLVMVLVSLVSLTSCCLPASEKKSTSQPAGLSREELKNILVGTWEMVNTTPSAAFMKMTYFFRANGGLVQRVVFDRRKSLEGMDEKLRSLQIQQWNGDLSTTTTDKGGVWKFVSPGQIEIYYAGTSYDKGSDAEERNTPEKWEGFSFNGNEMTVKIHGITAGKPFEQEQKFQKLQDEPAGASQGGLTEQDAVATLNNLIVGDHVFAGTAPECMVYFSEESDPGYFNLAIREKHGDGCPGDPNTTPVIGRFRVSRQNGAVEYYDVVDDNYIPYAQFKASRKGT